MNLFILSFYLLSVICFLLYFATRTALAPVSDVNFKRFQKSYLVVYLFATAGDWLQGPHVYALYEHYGMTAHQIEILFVAGFGSSLVFGTFVGSIADKYGRRANCILYGILYGGACITKHFGNFYILMIGRLLGGIATSILYSAFESWLIYEHKQRLFNQDWLGNIFSLGVLGNSLVAIFAGLIAQAAADRFGFVAPFDLSLLVLCIMCVIIVLSWPENYGDSTVPVFESLKKAYIAIKTDYKILCLGLVQSLFEGSMYVFVLEWTPALSPQEPTTQSSGHRKLLEDKMSDGHRGSIPHGQIFAAFMVSIMIGSSLFRLLCKYSTPESFMRPVLLVASFSLLLPILFPGDQLIIFCGFLIFETCVGIFWPSLGTMRGKYVPESIRATTMNFFRVPLNLIVVAILLQNLSMNVIFMSCFVFLLLGAMCQQWLHILVQAMVPQEQIMLQEEEVIDLISLEDEKNQIV